MDYNSSRRYKSDPRYNQLPVNEIHWVRVFQDIESVEPFATFSVDGNKDAAQEYAEKRYPGCRIEIKEVP